MIKNKVIYFNRPDRLLKKVSVYISDVHKFIAELPHSVKIINNILPFSDNSFLLKLIPLFGIVGDNHSVWVLFHLLTGNDYDEAVRRSAALQLNRLGPTFANPSVLSDMLIGQLNNADQSVRSNCALALGWKNNTIAADSLLTQLSDNDSDVQEAAVTALATIGGATVFKQLSLYLQVGSDDVQRCILLNLWRFEDQLARVESIYLDALDTMNTDLRLDAMAGLGMLPVSAAILKGYRQLLTDADQRVRCHVLDNLYKVDASEYRLLNDQLKQMLSDKDNRVRQAAIRLIAKK